MKSLTCTKLLQNFTLAMNKVCNDHEPIIVTRQNCDPVVMISLEDYNSLEETLYLMKNPKYYSRLIASIENVEKKLLVARSPAFAGDLTTILETNNRLYG